jgi:integrase
MGLLSEFDPAARERVSWNAGRKVGAKRALKPRQIWVIRFFLDQHGRIRDRALFDLAIDSKLRGCDRVKIRISDIVCDWKIRSRATVVQQKTGRPVQFELMDDARASLLKWLELRDGSLEDFAFPSRTDHTRPTSAHGNMPALLTDGSQELDCRARNTVPIPCGEPGRPSYTKPPEISVCSRSCWDIQRLKARSDILVWMWRTH